MEHSPRAPTSLGEDPLAAARREFAEETGSIQAQSDAMALGSFRQSSAKTIDIWAVEGEFDPASLKSNTFPMEWPPRSGRIRETPEVDRAEWFAPGDAARKLLKGQRPVLDALLRILDKGS